VAALQAALVQEARRARADSVSHSSPQFGMEDSRS
jgi:hypothetical protein